MKDITTIMNRYRECIRSLWNIYFLEQVSLSNDWDLCDEYEDISSLLFSSLVLRSIDQTSFKKAPGYKAVQEPISILRVIPCGDSAMSIFINRDLPCSGYWDFPVNMIKSSDVDLRFIDFFDFDRMGYRDFKYCRVRIIGSPTYPETLGRDALLESDNVTIIFDESLA